MYWRHDDMNSDQQQAVEFLRRLATWIEDQTELEYLSCNKWGTVPSVIFSGILDMSERLRVKPKPLESWVVVYGYYPYGVICKTKELAERQAEDSPDGFERIVHMREVEE
jgi:hypothetical protein